LGQYQNPGPNQPKNPVDRTILHINKEVILLQTRKPQYNMPPESTPTTSETNPTTTRQPLMIPRHDIELNPRIPRIPLQHNVHARVAHNYILVDDLV